MGTKVVYVGPHGEGVAISEAGVWAEHGEPVEVETELAERLLLQEDVWTRPTTKAARESKRRTTAERKPESTDPDIIESAPAPADPAEEQ